MNMNILVAGLEIEFQIEVFYHYKGMVLALCLSWLVFLKVSILCNSRAFINAEFNY
jgi:hypothetical protein